MIKYIEWLKENIGELPIADTIFVSGGKQYVDTAVPVMGVYDLINQLDEPEVLSQEWIDEYSYNIEEYWEVADMMDKPQYAVSVENLQNLLVPKQELPVIPKFVAEWIEHNKESGDIHTATNLNSIHTEIHFKEIYKNQSVELQEIIARAWLDGYTVGEEQKYVIDTDDVEISDGNHYLTHLSLSKDDTELPIVGYKDDAIRFDNKKQAQAIADYVGGRVEELEE